MSHLLKYSEWQSGSGRWHCNDVQDLCGNSAQWWAPARMMNITAAQYVKWLIDNFQPTYISFDGKLLQYSWAKEEHQKCHKFILTINRIAREKKFYC